MARKQRSAADWLKDADEAPRRAGQDKGRGIRPADKGRRAVAALQGKVDTSRELVRPTKTGVGRGAGIVDRAHDPMFRDAMAAVEAMQRRKGGR